MELLAVSTLPAECIDPEPQKMRLRMTSFEGTVETGTAVIPMPLFWRRGI